jgi:mRNA interferase MazF
VARGVARGDVWLYAFAPPDKRRPVVVISRQDALDHMDTALVAAITSTRRGAPSEVFLSAAHGLKGDCAVNLDSVHTVRQSALRSYVTTLAPDVMAQVCRALGIASGCR